MSKKVKSVWVAFALVGMGLLLSSCVTDEAGIPLRRSEYAYEPPVVRPTPTPEPDKADAAVVEDASSEKKGFFSFWSRGSKKDDPTDSTESRDAAVAQDADAESEVSTEEDAAFLPSDELEHAYRLKTGDRVFITLSGSGGLNEQVETLIDEAGGVKLRFIGSIPSVGLTATELEKEIEAEYTERQKIYKEVVARVVVPNTFYFLGGEVRQPGRFPLIGRVTLSQAIPSAGNFTEWANDRKIILARGQERYVINFREIASDPTKDIELQPGDVVTVERRSFL
jgi:polysaccharide export outer membrane protein